MFRTDCDDVFLSLIAIIGVETVARERESSDRSFHGRGSDLAFDGQVRVLYALGVAFRDGGSFRDDERIIGKEFEFKHDATECARSLILQVERRSLAIEHAIVGQFLLIDVDSKIKTLHDLLHYSGRFQAYEFVIDIRVGTAAETEIAESIADISNAARLRVLNEQLHRAAVFRLLAHEEKHPQSNEYY